MNAPIRTEAEANFLADRLGFNRPGEGVRRDWLLWKLRPADRSLTAGRPESPAHQRPEPSLFKTFETI